LTFRIILNIANKMMNKMFQKQGLAALMR
jgi:hypothetical protein